MSPAPSRIVLEPKPLNRSTRIVLQHIAMYCNEKKRLVQSVRQIADATFLHPKSVQDAVTRLNELQYIRTIAGAPNQRVSEHIVCIEVSELLKPVGGSGRSPRHKTVAGGKQ